MRIDVLGVGFDNLTMEEAVEQGMLLLHSEGAHYVVTPNPEIVEVCRESREAMTAVNGADLVLPDGIGVIKGAAMLGTPLKEKTPGIEFAAHIVERMAREGLSLYLLGAKPGVAEQAAKNLAARYPGHTPGCGSHQAGGSSAVDHGMAFSGHHLPQFFHRFHIFRIDQSAGRPKQTDIRAFFLLTIYPPPNAPALPWLLQAPG